MPEMIEAIRVALRSMGDGEISISAYDTAWVALVKSLNNGDDGPQFPSCIDWIAQNQLPDGSWGHDIFFLAQDRIINTLACIIALKSWKIHDDTCTKGMVIIEGSCFVLGYNSEHQIYRSTMYCWLNGGKIFIVFFSIMIQLYQHPSLSYI